MTHDDLVALLARLKKMLADYHALPQRERRQVDLHWRLADEFREHGPALIAAAEAGLVSEAGGAGDLRAMVREAAAVIRHAVSNIGMQRPEAAVRELEAWLEQHHCAATGDLAHIAETRAAAAERDRDALLARYDTAIARADDAVQWASGVQWHVQLRDKWSSFAVERNLSREAATASAARWQALIDDVRRERGQA